MSSKVLKSATTLVCDTNPCVLHVPGSEKESPQEEVVHPSRLMEDAKRVAAEHLEQARREAEQLRSQIRSEITAWMEQAREQIRREREAELERAREEGRRAGWEQGMRQAEAEYAERLRQVEALRREVEEWRNRLAEVTEAHVAEVALAVAERVVRKTVEVNREWVRAVAAEAVQALLPAHDIVVRVCPEDVEVLSEGQLSCGGEEVKVVPDFRLQPGDVWVTSSKGDIDARIDVVLEEAARVIRETARQAG
ncbi:MAG: hypothetical protein IRY98_05690 [Alicyclobacillaceae bacterium]|nr:hypothetical protein [Alicyclobacillaceae bacterium]